MYPVKQAPNQDRDKVNVVWNLFYHFYVPQNSINILRNQANSLLQASASYDSWLSSSYGRFINFLDKHTLAQLRQYWVQYATIKSPDHLEIRTRMAIAKRGEKIATSGSLTGLRSAGPMWGEAMDIISHVYRSFWQTGVAGGNLEDLTALGHNNRGFVNPMFAVSSAPAGDFAVHYGTEPLLGFHLAEAFVDTVGSPKANVIESVARAVRVAKTQFHDWCLSFKKYAERENVLISFFCGEALALCHELQVKHLRKDAQSNIARAYVKPWSSYPLVLDGLIDPTSIETLRLFDVIDTSNLGDHVGLINILSATAPLLRRQSSAVLYTESLLVASSNVETQLPVLLGSDVATFSLLLGLAPAGHLTGVTCEAVGNEAVLFNLIQQDQPVRQYRMRVPWIAPELTHPTAIQLAEVSNQKLLQITLEPADLALYLFEVYKNMFSHEDVTKLMSRLRRMKDEQCSMDLQRYTRAGFVAFLRVAKRRVSTDWNETMDVLLGEIDADKSLLVGSNSLQDLYTQLHLFDIFTSSTLETGPRNIRGMGLALRSRSQDKGFLAQNDVPPVVHMILTVPRKKLEMFTMRDPESVGTPAIHLSVRQTKGLVQYENVFYSFHCFFGTINLNGTDNLEYEEDGKGWLGDCDLIVSCPVPAFGLLTGPRDGIRVNLRLNHTPENFMKFSSLDPTLLIHESKLDDLLVCRDQPGLSSSHALLMQKRWTEISNSRNLLAPSIRVKMSARNLASHLQNRIDFVQGSPEGRVLAQGAEVTFTQTTPSSALLHVGKSHSQRLIYPFSINAAQSRIRIARKSSWVEVEVPISSAINIGGDYWTQLTLQHGFPPHSWSIPRVNLAIKPDLELPKMIKSSTWLSMFMGTSLSDAERAMQVSGSTTTPRFDFKESLNILFASFAGVNKNYGVVNTFQLTVNGDCHTLLFANSVRHDLDLGSIVMDAYVVPLTEPRVRKLMPALGKVIDSKVVAVKLSPGESKLWKSLLPALAERCRSWRHKPNCEYRVKGAPLSTANNKTPLCSCGEGKVDSEFHRNKLWAPFAKHATRIAIMPIFPVPYLEPLMSDIKKDLKASLAKPEVSSPPNTTQEPKQPGPVSPTGASRAPKCDSCGRTGTSLRACTGCGTVKYCNQACQKAAWKEHRTNCVKK